VNSTKVYSALARFACIGAFAPCAAAADLSEDIFKSALRYTASP
jgi:hypothetical protein